MEEEKNGDDIDVDDVVVVDDDDDDDDEILRTATIQLPSTPYPPFLLGRINQKF